MVQVLGWLVVEGDEAVFDGDADEAGEIVDAEFFHEAGTMFFDGAGADDHHVGDFRTGVAFGDELKDFTFAGGETVKEGDFLRVHEVGEEDL